jgi:hypothetical protein
MLVGLSFEQAVGEGMSLKQAFASGVRPPPNAFLLGTIEETGEMIAVALALRALILHLVNHIPVVRLAVEITGPAAAGPASSPR